MDRNTAFSSLQDHCVSVMVSCANGNLKKTSRALTQVYARILEPSGLQPTQFTLLVACAVAGIAPISALAEALIMDRTTLTRNLQLLEKQGLVSIATGDDRRVRMVSLSQAGRDKLATALPLWEQAQAHVVERFGQESLGHLLGELSRLTTVIRSA